MPKAFRDIVKYCEECGKQLCLNNTRDVKRKRFCSRSCRTKHCIAGKNKGVIYGLETRQRMRDAKLLLIERGWKPLGWRKYMVQSKFNNPPGYRSWGRRRLHQVVAERHMGRDLSHGEVVHHLNGVKTDNRPDNLFVMSRTDHNRLHAKIRKEQANAA